MNKCPNCKTRFANRPILKTEFNNLKDENGKILWGKVWHNINWKNLLIPDWFSFMFAITMIAVMYGHNYDMQNCYVVIENPDGFCENNGYLKVGNWGQRDLDNGTGTDYFNESSDDGSIH